MRIPQGSLRPVARHMCNQTGKGLYEVFHHLSVPLPETHLATLVHACLMCIRQSNFRIRRLQSRALRQLFKHQRIHSIPVLEKSLVLMMTQTQDFVRFAQKTRFTTAPVQPVYGRPNAAGDESTGPIER